MLDSTTHLYRPGDEPVAGYHLQAFLGRGGFGEVWRASGPGGVSAAVKILRDLEKHHGAKELRALRMLRDIRHPNLVPLIGYWIKDRDGRLLDEDASGVAELLSRSTTPPVVQEPPATGLRGTLQLCSPLPPSGEDKRVAADQPSELIMAMGLAEKSLFDWLRECQREGMTGVPLDELLTYMSDAARAIDLLNQKHDIQHCDIKPQNILLLNGAAQVCDFGLAKLVGSVRETSLGAGTIAYGAPEIFLGPGPTATTDQYSLAISYFELRTGGLPFPSERMSDVLLAKQHGTIDLSALPVQEGEVIARASAHDPAERFASCQEMVQALQASVAPGSRRSLVVAAPPARQTKAAGRGPRTNAAPAGSAGRYRLAAGLAAAILLGIGMSWLWPNRSANAIAELARADQVLAESQLALAAAERALAENRHQASEDHPADGDPGKSNHPSSPAAAAKSVSLDELREQLIHTVDHEQEIAQPESAADYYHNARLYERRGDYTDARQAYIRVCEFELEVVDPYLRLAHLLLLQEGRAGARQSMHELVGEAAVGPVSRFARLLVAPEEVRAEQWKAFVADYPDFAPAVYEWSRSYSDREDSVQQESDLHEEQQLLRRFLKLAEDGKFLSHFLDQSMAAGMLDDAQQRLQTLERVHQLVGG